MRQTALALATAMLALATPALADVGAVIDRHILPGEARFAAASARLAGNAADDCSPRGLAPAWNEAFDAWMGIAHLRIGPQEQASLTIAFWPDDRGAGRRTLARMIQSQDPMGTDPDRFAEVSAAARGLYALEAMLYDPALNGYGADSYGCTLVATMAADLAAQAATLEAGWREAFAPELRSAGAPDNALFLSEAEAQRALFTALHGGIEAIADQRLGRPMGSAERPRPSRAETWRSGRALRNILLSLDALHEMAGLLADTPIPRVDQAFANATYFAGSIADPAFQDVGNPMARFRLELLQSHVRAIGVAMISDIGEALGIAPGFNSLDGD